MPNFLTENKLRRSVGIAILSEKNNAGKKAYKIADKFLSVLREHYNMPLPKSVKTHKNKIVVQFNTAHKKIFEDKSVIRKLNKNGISIIGFVKGGQGDFSVLLDK